MNERIRELADIACFDEISKDYSLYFNLTKDKVEKFAELIVKECINVALTQKIWVEDQKIFNPHDDIWNRARIQQSERIVDKIKEHFGVEE